MRPATLIPCLFVALAAVFLPRAQGGFTPGDSIRKALHRQADDLSQKAQGAAAKRKRYLEALCAHLEAVERGKAGVDKSLGKQGTTALMLATALKEREAMRYLLLMGADPRRKDKRGRNAAAHTKSRALRKLLKEEAPLRTWAEAGAFLDKLPRGWAGAESIEERKRDWEQVQARGNPEACFRMAGSLFGRDGCAPLIGFLLRQCPSPRPGDTGGWFLRLYTASRAGDIGQEEYARQRALAQPYAMQMRGGGSRGNRLAWLAASVGDSSALSVLQQGGVDPSQPVIGVDGRGEPEEVGIPTLCRAELGHVWQLPVAAAAYGGHTEVFLRLLQHHHDGGMLDSLLAYACLSPNSTHFAEVEKALLARGARHGELSLACAAVGRSDDVVRRILRDLRQSGAGVDFTRVLLCMVADGVGGWKGNRCALAAELAGAGADIHALESMPEGMDIHPFYSLFSSCTNEAIELYAALAHLGMDEGRVLSLPMTPAGKSLLMACDANQAAYLGWSITPRIVIDLSLQRLWLEGGAIPFSADISSGKAGAGFAMDSSCTPTGNFTIHSRLGEGLPPMTMFRQLAPVGTWPESARPGEIGILARILTLDGKDRENANTRARNIYIHGTSEPQELGQPASHGCIRLSPEDMVQLFELVPEGMEVIIRQ